MTKITAHRGDNEHYPENTLIAFQQAAKKGADRIELDVQMTADGQLVVHHDYMLGRTSAGQGLIQDCTADYLRSQDAGTLYAPNFSDQKIPFLREVFEMTGFEGEYEIELKTPTIGCINNVLSLVEQYALTERVEFTSPHQFLLAKLCERVPDATIGFFVPTFPDWMDNKLGQSLVKAQLELGICRVAHCALDDLTEEFIREIQTAGYKIHVADADTEDKLKRAYALSVDQLSTDKLSLAQEIRAQN